MKKLLRIVSAVLSLVLVAACFCLPVMAESNAKEPAIKSTKLYLTNSAGSVPVTTSTVFSEEDKLTVIAVIQPNGLEIEGATVVLSSTAFPDSCTYAVGKTTGKKNTYRFQLSMKKISNPVKGDYLASVAISYNDKRFTETLAQITIGFGAEAFEPGTIVLSTPTFEKATVAPGESVDMGYTAKIEGAVPEGYNTIDVVGVSYYQNDQLIDSDNSLQPEDDTWVVDIPKNATDGELIVKTWAEDSMGNKKWSSPVTLTVQSKAVTKLRFTKKTVQLEKGTKNFDIADLYLRVTPSGACWNFTWSSSNKKIATVKDGKITTRSKGSCRITCKVPGKNISASFKLVVK